MREEIQKILEEKHGYDFECFTDKDFELFNDVIESVLQLSTKGEPKPSDGEIEKAHKLFLKGVDNYLYEQETHILGRAKSELSTIKAVVHWCKFHAEHAFKSLTNQNPIAKVEGSGKFTKPTP